MLNKPQKALKLNASKSKGDVSKSKWDVSKVKRNVSKNASKTKWDSLAAHKLYFSVNMSQFKGRPTEPFEKTAIWHADTYEEVVRV